MTGKTQDPNKDGRQYEIGYGKPPVATRFKPGQSGNPKGRKKGSLAIGTLLKMKLQEKVSVIEGGKERKLTRQELIVHKVLNGVMKGDPKAMQAFFTMAKARGLIEPALQPEFITDNSVVDEEDRLIVERFRKRKGSGSE